MCDPTKTIVGHFLLTSRPVQNHGAHAGGFTAFGGGTSYLMVWFSSEIQKFSLGDGAHHTVTTVKTKAVFTYVKALYSICSICNAELKILVANAKILAEVFSKDK